MSGRNMPNFSLNLPNCGLIAPQFDLFWPNSTYACPISNLMIIRPLKALRAEWFCTFWKLTWFTLFRFYFLFETFVIVSQHVVHEHVKKLMDKLKGNFSWCCIENWRFSRFSIFFHFFCSGACKFFSLRDAKLILPLQTPMAIPCV